MHGMREGNCGDQQENEGGLHDDAKDEVILLSLSVLEVHICPIITHMLSIVCG